MPVSPPLFPCTAVGNDIGLHAHVGRQHVGRVARRGGDDAAGVDVDVALRDHVVARPVAGRRVERLEIDERVRLGRTDRDRRRRAARPRRCRWASDRSRRGTGRRRWRGRRRLRRECRRCSRPDRDGMTPARSNGPARRDRHVEGLARAAAPARCDGQPVAALVDHLHRVRADGDEVAGAVERLHGERRRRTLLDGAGSGRRMNAEPVVETGLRRRDVDAPCAGPSSSESITCSRTTSATGTSAFGATVTWMSADGAQSPLPQAAANATSATSDKQRIRRRGYTAPSPFASGRPCPAAAGRAQPSARFWHSLDGWHTDGSGPGWRWWSSERVAIDLGVHRHQRRPLTLRAAVAWSLLWIGLSVGYGALVWWRRGGVAATAVLHGVAAREVAQLRQPHGLPARLHALQGARGASATACSPGASSARSSCAAS